MHGSDNDAFIVSVNFRRLGTTFGYPPLQSSHSIVFFGSQAVMEILLTMEKED